MFSERIDQIWQDWYDSQEIKKFSWIVWLLVGVAVMIAGIVILKYSLYGAFVILCGMIIWITVAFIVCNREAKITESAADYCRKYQIYKMGFGKSFPFLQVRTNYCLGGQLFEYDTVDVALYDTGYTGKNNSPGMLIEFILHNNPGTGNLCWKNGHIEKSGELLLEDRFVHCVEEIIKYQRAKQFYTKCIRNENSFYIYAMYAAMGLIVDESGRLRTGGAGRDMWKSADDILDIIQRNLG